jgi:hypothetical protein
LDKVRHKVPIPELVTKEFPEGEALGLAGFFTLAVTMQLKLLMFLNNKFLTGFLLIMWYPLNSSSYNM